MRKDAAGDAAGAWRELDAERKASEESAASMRVAIGVGDQEVMGLK